MQRKSIISNKRSSEMRPRKSMLQSRISLAPIEERVNRSDIKE